MKLPVLKPTHMRTNRIEALLKKWDVWACALLSTRPCVGGECKGFWQWCIALRKPVMLVEFL
jgi:hypothetical protein